VGRCSSAGADARDLQRTTGHTGSDQKLKLNTYSSSPQNYRFQFFARHLKEGCFLFVESNVINLVHRRYRQISKSEEFVW
jgi:hypothetical protein